MSLANFSAAGGLGPSAPPPYIYSRVTAGSPGGKTTIHAVLDYDDDFADLLPDPGGEAGDYTSAGEFAEHLGGGGRGGGIHGTSPGEGDFNAGSNSHNRPRGPIAYRGNNASGLPVVPLYSFGTQSTGNGSLIHIPVLWTALSLALGLEIRGDIIRGTPCIKKYHQLFCPTAGNTYPLERIELFIDENKALIKRMYGEFESGYSYPGGGGGGGPGAELYEEQRRGRRQTSGVRLPTSNHTSDSGRVDACQSKVEIVTPYWAANSAGKIRAIVNTQHFEQAIHQEVCSKVQTNRCSGDCGCEQKYKWHRLLAYDPDNDCKGIFMDWFLFPSCCVCRCMPNTSQQQISRTRG